MGRLKAGEDKGGLTLQITAAIASALDRGVKEILHDIPAHNEVRAGGVGVEAGAGLAAQVPYGLFKARHGPLHAHGAGGRPDDPGHRRNPFRNPVHDAHAHFDGRDLAAGAHVRPCGTLLIGIIGLNTCIKPFVLREIRENIGAFADLCRDVHRLSHHIFGGFGILEQFQGKRLRPGLDQGFGIPDQADAGIVGSRLVVFQRCGSDVGKRLFLLRRGLIDLRAGGEDGRHGQNKANLFHTPRKSSANFAKRRDNPTSRRWHVRRCHGAGSRR